MDILMSLFLFISFLLCLFVITTARSRRSSAGAAALPPGPPRWPVIGNIHQMGKRPHRSLGDLSRTYGAIMSVKLGTLTTVVVSSAEAAKEVLQTHDHVLSYRTAPDVARATGQHNVSILWLPPLARWRLLRKICANQLFSPQRLDASRSLRMNKVQELLNFLIKHSETGEPIDIARVTFVTVINIVSRSLFSIDFASYDSEASDEYQDIVARILEVGGRVDFANFFPILGIFDLQGTRKESRKHMEKIFQVFQELIDARARERSSQTKAKDVSSTDMLDYLLDLIQENESELNMIDIKQLLSDLFVAGTTTTSGAVEWAMAELLKNPEKMAKAQDEIMQVISETKAVQESDIVNLPYLQAVVKETLRLHPPAPFLAPRKAESDTRIFGFLIPKNTQVLVNVWAIGQDPSLWDNPMQFEPERFLGREIDVKGKDFELIPFGAGRRICPGMPLALRSLPLLVASLLHSFDWKLQNGVVPKDLDMEESCGITLHKAKPLHAVPIKKTHVEI